MGKLYEFIKIEDKPFTDPLINENEKGEKVGPFSQRGLLYEEGGNHNSHDFPGMTNEQVDALRYIVNKHGVGINELQKTRAMRMATPEEKTALKKNTFSKFAKYDEKRIKKYYYSKALYDKFPEKSEITGEDLSLGVFILMNEDFNFPLDMFSSENRSDTIDYMTVLKEAFIQLKGNIDDTDYIINAKNNADLKFIERRPEGFPVQAYDPHMTISNLNKISELPKMNGQKLNQNIVFNLSKSFATFYDLFEYLKENHGKTIPNLSFNESVSVIVFFKKYATNYPTAFPEEWRKIIFESKIIKEENKERKEEK